MESGIDDGAAGRHHTIVADNQRMRITLADLITASDSAYPPDLAEEWDTGIGLTCGDPTAIVNRVLLAVDANPRTVDEAISRGADVLLTHHPLLFRPVQSVALDTAKGALIHRLIRAGIAHFAAHTNADRAVGGVNDALAAALGLTDTRPLEPGVAPASPTTGIGRIGRLPTPMPLAEFAERVASALPATVTGARVAGDPKRLISTVAVCGGAGASLLPAAAAANVDVFLTSDLTHHTAVEYSDDPTNPALVDVAHWAGEWPWLPVAAATLTEALGGKVEMIVSRIPTDPWVRRTDGR